MGLVEVHYQFPGRFESQIHHFGDRFVVFSLSTGFFAFHDSGFLQASRLFIVVRRYHTFDNPVNQVLFNCTDASSPDWFQVDQSLSSAP